MADRPGVDARFAALVDWAESLVRSGRWDDEARFVNGRILQLDAGNENALTRLAGCHVVSGDLVRAEQAFREALAVNPDNVTARNGLTDVLARMNPPALPPADWEEVVADDTAADPPLDRKKAG